MNAKVFKLDCCGREIWRLMATRNGQLCGLGHMMDFDTRDEAETAAIDHARRNRWDVYVEIFFSPGKSPGSTRSIPAQVA